MLVPGDIVAGKYRIERPLGEGGMGAVFVAVNEKLQKRVALKLLRREVANVPGAAERFTREAIAASSAKHPGIIEIYDADSHEGLPWIAMELLEGETLSSRMERGRIPIPEVIDIACEALAALAHVHRAGILHRDLKPDNLFLEALPEGGRRVKILDFGIAASSRPELVRVTQTGMAIGTPAYLAPEQAAGKSDLDARVDVYAMGVILFELITGRLPYAAGSLGEIVMLMFTQGPPRLGREVPSLPPALGAIVDLCLAVEREHRVQSAETLRRELESIRPLVRALSVPPTHEVPAAHVSAGALVTRELSHAPTLHATPSAPGSTGVPGTGSSATPPGYAHWTPPGAPSSPGALGFAPTMHSAPAMSAPDAYLTPASAGSYGSYSEHPPPRLPQASPARGASRTAWIIGGVIALGLVVASIAGAVLIGGGVYLANRETRSTTTTVASPPVPLPAPPMEPLAPEPVPQPLAPEPVPQPLAPEPEPVAPASDSAPREDGAGTRRSRVSRRLEPHSAPEVRAAIPTPPPAPVPADPGTPRPLDNATIVRVLQSNEAALDRCYFDAYPEQPRPRVRTEVDLTISSAGRVTDSSIVSPRPLLSACVRRVLSGVRFPAHPHSTRARFPMTFHE